MLALSLIPLLLASATRASLAPRAASCTTVSRHALQPTPTRCVTSYSMISYPDPPPTSYPAVRYTTSALSFTTPKPTAGVPKKRPAGDPYALVPGAPYVSSLEVNGVKVRGTFDGQDSPYLPKTPWLPCEGQNASSYADLLGSSMLFYETQRAGLLRPDRRPAWRQSAALSDGVREGVDLTGGFFDAGNYIKVTFTLSSTISYLALGGSQHARGYRSAGQLGYLDQTLRWAYDWLIKAHTGPTELWALVGDSVIDNDGFNPETHILYPRPSFKVTAQHPGTDLVANTAAAFAAGSVIYTHTLGDPAYAAKLLKRAESLYEWAVSGKKGKYSDSVIAARDSYESYSYRDELVWAALHLYRATGRRRYATDAVAFAKSAEIQYAEGPGVDWDSKEAAALVLGAQLAASSTTAAKDLAGFAFHKHLGTFVDGILRAEKTCGGLLWFGQSSQDTTLSAALNVAWVLWEYSALSRHGDDAKAVRRAHRAKQLALSQIDYTLGRNPEGLVYVVGASSRSPQRPQSAMAYARLNADDIDVGPNKYVLYGALVGGPNWRDVFSDKRSDWQQTEAALDYNALWSGLLAAQVEAGRKPFFLR